MPHASRARAGLRRLLALLRRSFLAILALIGQLGVRRRLPTPVRHILVIKPDHLGDVLLATPALRLLRQQHPQARIVALLGPWSALMLAHNPDIDTVLTLPFPGFARQQTQSSRFAFVLPYLVLLRYAALLRAERFDTALLLRDDHWWGAALALLAGIPRRVGYAVPECAPFLSHALHWNPAQHVTVQGLALVQAIGDGDGAQGSVATPTRQVRPPDLPSPRDLPLRFTPSPADQDWATSWLRQHNICLDERLVVLHPGTGGPAKLWVPERWAAVANALVTRPNLRLLLTGGPGEEALVAQIAAQIQQPVLTLVGMLSVGQLATLLGRAALVLGVDSGPLHIAVSQGTPSLHLFGPSDAGRFGPWGDAARHRVVRADLWCSPCAVFSACPRGTSPPECMERIVVDAVLRAAIELIEAC